MQLERSRPSPGQRLPSTFGRKPPILKLDNGLRDGRMPHNEFNQLLSSLNALSPEQMRRLRHELDQKLAASPADASLTPEQQEDQEVQRRLFAAGLVSEIKPPIRVVTGTERCTPIRIAGEPLSETIIRDRR